MAREPIVGSGHKGFDFEKKGFQERNLQLLLDTLSKKETQKSLEALSKIDKDEWKAMASTAETLNSFVSLGGTSELITILTGSIKETITLQIESVLSPLKNEINQQITDLINPFLNNLLTPFINDVTSFIAENTVGAGVGGIVGGVIGAFLGNPAIGALIGGLVGSGVELALERFFSPEVQENLVNIGIPNLIPFVFSRGDPDYLGALITYNRNRRIADDQVHSYGRIGGPQEV